MDVMTPEHWRRIKAIASDALDRLPVERHDYVHESCAGDAVLAAEVLALLDDATAATPYFEAPPATSSAAWLASGTHIGPYYIVRELASGGMGTVYLAERDDGAFQQRVAIKLVRGGFPSLVLRE